MLRVLLLNGSIRGAESNTGWLLHEAARRLASRADCALLHLAEAMPSVAEVRTQLEQADAIVVGTGTYWTSWGSPLQRFLEVMTPFENTPAFLGKPVAALVTMDSVGGAELAARLLGVFNQLGCLVPPCSTLVLSRVASARAARPLTEIDAEDDDVWQLADLDLLLHNLTLAATAKGPTWEPWPVRQLIATPGPWPHTGALELGAPRFLPPAAPRR